MNELELAQQIEGLLFTLGKPLSRTELVRILEVDAALLEGAITKLAASEGRGIVLVDDGMTLELRATPAAAQLIEKVRRDENSRDIGRAGLEVLAALAYRGPLTRAEIDFIRGVNSSQILRTLSMRGLINKVSNPKDERSFLYEITTELLAKMSATHPRDLPDFDSVREKLAELEASYRSAQGE